MATTEGSFVWYELMTGDPAAAEQFYTDVVGWRMTDSGMPDMRYTIANAGDHPIGGITGFPPDMPDPHPAWTGYVHADDVDEVTGRVQRAGGAQYRAPADIPGVGRFAVVADPTGAVFLLFHGNGPTPDPLPMNTPGRVAWHELHTTDWEKAFAFYQGLFGWEKDNPMDMGEMGTYQIFKIEGVPSGGMMNNKDAPAPFWLYYFVVDDIDAAAERVTGHGGKIIHGPSEVPGEMWIINAFDPQGAIFALVGPRK